MTIYCKAGDGVVFEEFDGDLVVLDLSSGRYFGLNDTGALLWHGLMEAVDENTLAAALGGAGPDAERMLHDFVQELVSFGLIRADDSSSAKPLRSELAAELGRPQTAPAIEPYDDLADLIVADPIHDVDEDAGWPHVKTST